MVDVFVLAAGSVKDKLYFSDFIFPSPALIPINVRSVSSYILDFYASHNTKVHLVINKDDQEIVERELCYYSHINIIPIDTSHSVIDSLQQSLRIVLPKNDVIVNIVTTIPTVFPVEAAIQLSCEEDLNSQWSGIKIKNGKADFYRKNEKPLVECNAFTGLFRCHAKDLSEILATSITDSDLVTVAEQLHCNNGIDFQYVQWIDCGHELNFYQAKSKLISSRSFNSVKIEPKIGVLSKSSRNVKKFREEVKYIQLLPQELSVYFPRLYGDVRVSGDVASVSMEYYGYNTLAEHMLYWSISEHVWRNIFSSLQEILSCFRGYEYSIGKQAYTDFYLNKTISRVRDFEAQLIDNAELSARLFADRICINGLSCDGFSLLLPRVEERLDALYSEDDFCIMHGDLCFNNILYDVKSSVTRLIDARGSFGDRCIGIYGDIKYDLAKVTHSVIGGYDFIVNNLFSLSQDEHGFAYSINYRDNHEFLIQQNRELISSLGFNEKDILFVVGLLFMSMCPLHHDDIKRQTAMYIHGLNLVNQSFT